STLRPMTDVRRSGNVLSFSYDDDGYELSKFELRLIDPNSADLTVLLPEEERQQLAAEGIPLPKPFRLAKFRSRFVRPAGFEPAAYSSGGCRSIQLSYGRVRERRCD